MRLVFLFAAFAMLSFPAHAQLSGSDTAPGASCAGFPTGATRMTADPDGDGTQVTLVCNGTTWQQEGIVVLSKTGDPPTADGGSLQGLSDVSLSSPAGGEVLLYSAGNWINGTGGGGGGALNDLSDAATDYTTDFNMFIGSGAGGSITTGQNNTIIGRNAGSGADLSGSVIIGNGAAPNVNSWTTAIGHSAGAAASGWSNTFVGQYAGMRQSGGSVAVGTNAGGLNQGGENVLIGVNAGQGDDGDGLTNASRSVMIGHSAGSVINLGNDNIFIGHQAGDAVTDGGSNIVLGHQSDVSSATASNELNIGNVIYGTGLYGTGNIGINDPTPDVALDVVGDINYTGVIVDVSDIRMKYDIEPLESPLSKLTSLNGFSFKMKDGDSAITEYGVSAQDVQSVFPELVHEVDADGTLGVSYDGLIAPMIEAMKEQQAQIEALQAEIEILKSARGLAQDNSDINKLDEL